MSRNRPNLIIVFLLLWIVGAATAQDENAQPVIEDSVPPDLSGTYLLDFDAGDITTTEHGLRLTLTGIDNALRWLLTDPERNVGRLSAEEFFVIWMSATETITTDAHLLLAASDLTLALSLTQPDHDPDADTLAFVAALDWVQPDAETFLDDPAAMLDALPDDLPPGTLYIATDAAFESALLRTINQMRQGTRFFFNEAVIRFPPVSDWITPPNRPRP